jgi:chromosome segregation ATPase
MELLREQLREELDLLQLHYESERKARAECEARLRDVEDELETERLLSKQLHDEVRRGKENLKKLLSSMESVEMEVCDHCRVVSRSRQRKRQARENEKQLNATIQGLATRAEQLQAELDEERAMRLQHMFMISKHQLDRDQAAKEVTTLHKQLQLSEREGTALVKHLESVNSALRASQRCSSHIERDLQATSAANLEHKMETHELRLRLVEATEDAALWRKKFDELSLRHERDKSARVLARRPQRATGKVSALSRVCAQERQGSKLPVLSSKDLILRERGVHGPILEAPVPHLLPPHSEYDFIDEYG